VSEITCMLVDIQSLSVHFQTVVHDLPLRRSCDVVKDLLPVRAVYPCRASSVACSSQHCVTSESDMVPGCHYCSLSFWH